MKPEDANDPLLGRVIDGKFTILSVLGRGGMGVVYRAHQASLDRPVALKLMAGVDPAREAEFQRRFFLEAATAAKLKNPNTITVFDYGSTVIEGGPGSALSDEGGDRVYYITMELLEGQTLSRLLNRHAPLPPLRAIHIGTQMCRSLREAHRAGVVHRDLKPGNVMLVRQDDEGDAEGDFVKVLDFGLARHGRDSGVSGAGALTKAGTFMGSPRYVAPEQIEGRPVDGRADIYSFGCVLYRMLTGRVPFDGTQAVEIMLKHLNEPAPPLDVDVPPSLHRLVIDCLQKEIERRPASMDDVLLALKRARAELLGVSTSGAIHVTGELRLPGSAEGVVDADVISVSSPRASVPPGARASRGSLPPSSTPHASSSPHAAPITAPTPPAPSPTLRAHDDEGSSSGNGGWVLGNAPMSIEDSTRPTRVLGRLTLEPSAVQAAPPQRRALGALAAGLALGLSLCAVFLLWRLDGSSSSPRPQAKAPPPVAPAAPSAQAERTVTVRIVSVPAGADVFERAEGGLPRLVGVTPLRLPWRIQPGDGARVFTVQKKGFRKQQATVTPPSADSAPWIDVEATLRPEAP